MATRAVPGMFQNPFHQVPPPWGKLKIVSDPDETLIVDRKNVRLRELASPRHFSRDRLTRSSIYVDLCAMQRIRRSSGQTLNLLRALMDEPRKWHHGYELSKSTGLLSGTLYPILMRLSDRGFLDHKWMESPDGVPPRHAYRLTAKGIAHAKEQFELCAEVGAQVSGSVSRA